MSSILREKESPAIIIGGVSDHVHILCVLSKKITLSKLVEEIKKNSSKWLKTKAKELSAFYWQNGYGAFSVSQLQLNIVKKYIQNQKEHHRGKTYKEEVSALLKKYEVKYDDRYLWD